MPERPLPQITECTFHMQELVTKLDSMQKSMDTRFSDVNRALDELRADVKRYSEQLIELRVDYSSVREDVKGLDETIYGNGKPGLKTQVAIIVSLGMAVMSVLSVLSLFLRT